MYFTRRFFRRLRYRMIRIFSKRATDKAVNSMTKEEHQDQQQMSEEQPPPQV